MAMAADDPAPESGPIASEHLARARAAHEANDPTATAVWAALALESAISITARKLGIDDRKDHYRRSTLARRLYESGHLPEDLSSVLIRLNTERKLAVHEGKKPDLRGRDWEMVLDAVARAVAAAGP